MTIVLNSVVHYKYFSCCIVCISNAFQNLIWFIVAHLNCIYWNPCPHYSLVGEIKFIHSFIHSLKYNIDKYYINIYYVKYGVLKETPEPAIFIFKFIHTNTWCNRQRLWYFTHIFLFLFFLTITARLC